MAETPIEHNDRMFRITQLSPRAKQIIESASYHMSFQVEEIDNETIRQEIFIGLVEDLEELGIYFTCPNETVYAVSMVTLDHVLDVLEWVMPSQLYPKMRARPELVSGIEAILQGVNDYPIMDSYMDYLGGGYNSSGIQEDLHEAVEFFKYNARTTAVFSQYLETLLALFRSERVSSTAILTSPEEWLTFHDTVIERTAVAFDALVDQQLIEESDVSKMTKRLRVHLINALVSPDRHERMVYLYLTDYSGLSEEGKIFYDKCWKEYRTGSKFFSDFFVARQLPITTFDMLGFILYSYAITHNALEFQTQLEKIKADYVAHAEILGKWGAVLLTSKETEKHGE